MAIMTTNASEIHAQEVYRGVDIIDCINDDTAEIIKNCVAIMEWFTRYDIVYDEEEILFMSLLIEEILKNEANKVSRKKKRRRAQGELQANSS